MPQPVAILIIIIICYGAFSLGYSRNQYVVSAWETIERIVGYLFRQ